MYRSANIYYYSMPKFVKHKTTLQMKLSKLNLRLLLAITLLVGIVADSAFHYMNAAALAAIPTINNKIAVAK
jgi:hypothetical protein